MIALPYLVFLGDADREVGVKTAQGVLHWRPEQVAGQFRLPGCELDLGIPDMDYETAVAAGARTVLIGIANRGGFCPSAGSSRCARRWKPGSTSPAGCISA